MTSLHLIAFLHKFVFKYVWIIEYLSTLHHTYTMWWMCYVKKKQLYKHNQMRDECFGIKLTENRNQKEYKSLETVCILVT